MKNLNVVKSHQRFSKFCSEKNSLSNGTKIKKIEIRTKKLSNFTAQKFTKINFDRFKSIEYIIF